MRKTTALKTQQTANKCSRHYVGSLFCPYDYINCKTCPNAKKLKKKDK